MFSRTPPGQPRPQISPTVDSSFSAPKMSLKGSLLLQTFVVHPTTSNYSSSGPPSTIQETIQETSFTPSSNLSASKSSPTLHNPPQTSNPGTGNDPGFQAAVVQLLNAQPPAFFDKLTNFHTLLLNEGTQEHENQNHKEYEKIYTVSSIYDVSQSRLKRLFGFNDIDKDSVLTFKEFKEFMLEENYDFSSEPKEYIELLFITQTFVSNTPQPHPKLLPKR